MHFTFKQLRYFEATARLGSISLAADELAVSPSAIASSIDGLEARLGVHLMMRRPAKGVELTPTGRAFAVHTQAILEELAAFDAHISSLGQSIRGNLRIGYFSSAAPYFIPRIVTKCARLHPDLALTMVESLNEKLTEMLLSGALDVVFGFSTELSQTLSFAPLFEAHTHAVVAADHPCAKRGSVRLKDLLGESFILPTTPEGVSYFRNLFTALGLKPDIVYHSQNYEMILNMVAARRGVSLFSVSPNQPELDRFRRVVRLPLEDPLPSLSYGITYRKLARNRHVIREFVDLSQSAFSREEWAAFGGPLPEAAAPRAPAAPNPAL
ncbi:LysR substrate-binding domain-containing protein [Aquibium sp. A9E412]|uniref:LysR family transcriptional regulator n=1 Tax=Aquibium sp. A9E412 TaxID=2976767 RepID=UPI0025B055B7|nr:LysR substrate-binding domain-containing protein [Aquibium sp. A9E412]MDN2567770.1 LysR substrate-binding domain-containing protein [Aquibium sp. A9E412]